MDKTFKKKFREFFIGRGVGGFEARVCIMSDQDFDVSWRGTGAIIKSP
jgi:hypothetical protein